MRGVCPCPAVWVVWWCRFLLSFISVDLNRTRNFVQGMMAGDRISRGCGGQIGAGLQEVAPLMSANIWEPRASD